VLPITGAGKALCRRQRQGHGRAPRQEEAEMSYDEKVADLWERQRLLTGALASVRKPTIAALPGPAVGAGPRWPWPATSASLRNRRLFHWLSARCASGDYASPGC
jgi:hypothetical protein